MGFELLGTGAGAAHGLEDLLTRQRADELMRQQGMEKVIGLLGLREDRQARLGQQKMQADALAQSRADANKARLSNVNLQQLQALPSGTVVGENTFNRFTNPETGAAAPEAFDKSLGTPASLPSTSLSGFLPINQGEMGAVTETQEPSKAIAPSFRFKGTAQENEKDAAQKSLDMSRMSAIDAKTQGLSQAAERLAMQGRMNEANIGRAGAEAELARARAGAAEKKAGTLTLSQRGKDARAAIEQAGPLTDQVMEMIRKEAPDIEKDPQKYNTLIAKATALFQKGRYKLGFYDDTDPRQQLVSLLQPIQAGQYTRSSRSRQMLELALKHMADPGQTLLTQYQRAKELKSIMPEMLEGIVRGEQPVDSAHPLSGSYFDPAKAPATGGVTVLSITPVKNP